MEYRTNRLEVRPFRESDRDDMIPLLTDTQVAKTYMLPEFETPDQAVPVFQRLLNLSQTPDRYVAGICLDGRCIGFMNDVEKDDGRIEMGYAMLPAYWNRGYMTEAFAGAIEYLFGVGFKQVIAGAFEENPASMRVMVKCGMTLLEQVDQIEYRGKVHRCLYYGLCK